MGGEESGFDGSRPLDQESLMLAFKEAITNHESGKINDLIKHGLHELGMTVEQLTEIYQEAFDQTTVELFKEEKDNGKDI